MRIIICIVFITFSYTSPSMANYSQANHFFLAGAKFLKEKEYSDAIKEFEKAAKQNPKHLDTYLEWARGLVLSRKRKAGLEKLTQAMAIAKSLKDKRKIRRQYGIFSEIFYTNDVFQKYQDGLNLLKAKKLREALRNFEQSLAKEPFNALILLAYGQTLRGLDDWSASVKALEQVFILNPHKKELRFQLSLTLLNRRPKQSLKLMKPLLQSKNNREKDIILYARVLGRLGELHKAIELLEKNKAKRKAGIYTLYWLGKLYSQTTNGNWQARKYLTIFLRQERRLPTKTDSLTLLRKDGEKILSAVNDRLGLESSNK